MEVVRTTVLHSSFFFHSRLLSFFVFVLFFFVVLSFQFDLVVLLFGFLWRRHHGITAPAVSGLAELCEPDAEPLRPPHHTVGQEGPLMGGHSPKGQAKGDN